MFDPLLHKKPYGATFAGGATTITFPLDYGTYSDEIKRVFIVLRQVYGEGGAIDGESVRIELPLISSDFFDVVFEKTITLDKWGVYMYRFEGEYEDGSLAFFGRGDDGTAIQGDWLPEWQLTVTKYDYKTPDWAKHGVIYQIFADRFCKVGDAVFNKSGKLHTYWNDRPDIQEPDNDYRADDFFGGNAKGIISRLDYIKSLGVSCIYLSPIFESWSNHRYDTADYLKIDELFGSEEDFAKLIFEAKKRGIAIILDGVFNHTGADSLYFNREGRYPTLGAYQSTNSPYYDWYTFYDYPTSYHCWWGSTVVPTVNKSAKGFKELLLGKNGVIDKWGKLGISGWRLDVVDELPIDFTTELCSEIRSSGKDMLIVGEVWEDATVKIAYDEWRPYFMGDQLDSAMNYPFKEAILSFALTSDRNAFINSITTILEHYPKQSLDAMMNLIDSHDTVRALTYLSGVTPPCEKQDRANFLLSKEQYELAKKRLMFASTLQYVLPGVPCLFYGDEAGVQGFEDPLNRVTYPWGNEDKELIKHYKALGKFREKYANVLTGETSFKPYGGDGLVIFERKTDNEHLTVFANSSDKPVTALNCPGKDVFTGKSVGEKFVIKSFSVKIIYLSD